MPGHLTGLRTIRNLSNSAWKVIRSEDFPDGGGGFHGGTGTLIVPANDHRTFGGESIPWATNQAQIRRKAFSISKNPTRNTDGHPFWYLFQDEAGNICWAPNEGINTSYERRHQYNQIVDNISMVIFRDDTISIAPA